MEKVVYKIEKVLYKMAKAVYKMEKVVYKMEKIVCKMEKVVCKLESSIFGGRIGHHRTVFLNRGGKCPSPRGNGSRLGVVHGHNSGNWGGNTFRGVMKFSMCKVIYINLTK